MSGTVVNIPDVGQVAFPEGMSDADIEDAIKTKIIPQHGEVAAKQQGQALGASNGNMIDNTVRQLAQGASLGYGDEFAAMMDAATHGALGRGSGADTYGQRYDENLARERGQNQGFEAAHPYIAGGAKVVGNVASAIAAAPSIGVGSDLLGNMARFGTAGAGLGAVQGFGEGEGGLANRAASGATGAAVGGLGGVAVPIAGTLANKAVDAAGVPILNRLATLLGAAPAGEAKSLSAAAPDGSEGGFLSGLGDMLRSTASNVDANTAARNIGQYIVRGKVSPDQLSARAGELGNTPYTLADLSEPTLGAANAARLESPEVRNLAKTVMEDRAKQYSPMLTDAFTGGADVPSLYKAGQAFDANARSVGTDLYGQMRDSGLTVSPQMEEMQQIPAVAKAIQSVQEDAANTGTTLHPVDIMDRVKQKLNDTASAAFASGKPVNKADVGDLAGNWERAFWQANPAAQTASQGYQIAKSLPEYTDMGRRFMQEGTSPGQTEVSAEAVADKLAEARSGQQPAAYTLGVQNAGRSAAQMNPTAFARKLTPESEGVVSKIQQALGDEGSDRVLQAADAVRTFANTKNRLMGGSSTLPNAEDVSVFNHARIGIGKSGKVFENIRERLGEALGKVEAPSERVTNRIGDMLLSPYPEENQKTLAMLAKLLASKSHSNALKATAASSAAQNTTGNF